MQTIGYGLRQLRRNPGFAAVAVLTLALGIGANTAIFSVLDGVVLSPLPYREPDRLAVVALYNRNLKYATNLSYPDFLDWQRSTRSFQQIAAFASQGFDLTNPGTPEHLPGNEVSSTFFSTLGVKLALGRNFSPQEDRFGGMSAAIISDGLWQDRFDGNPAALGKTITLSGVNYTIVGVLPRGFRFGNEPADVYTPLGRGDPVQRNDRTVHNILSIARLKPDVSIGQAKAEMDTVQERIDELNPATERGLGTYIVPLKQFLVGDISGTILLLLGAVGVVLLIACANVANLLLARSAARSREFAIRRALGASRGQIVRQLLSESVLLSLIGGALGLAFAQWGLKAVLAAVPRMPRIENIGWNAPVLLFAFGVSMLVGIVFALIPALKNGRGFTGGHHRTQRVLVVFQIAMALILLTGASLLFRTIRNLLDVNPGFDAQRVITFKVRLTPALTRTPPSTRVAYQQLMERIRQIPGVQAADITGLLPLSQLDNSGPFWVGSRQTASMAELPRALYYWTGPDYIRALGIPLQRGRFLRSEDTASSERVVAIDSVMARSYFPNRDPVGQSINIPHWGVARVVGVVGHVQHYSLDGSALYEKPQIYASFYQLLDQWVPTFRSDISIAVRTSLEASSVLPAIKNAVYGAGSGQPVYNVRAMRDIVSASMAAERFPMILLSAFAILALLLATVGIYGVISYSMTQRVRELGIRMALGAVQRDVVRMVIGEGLCMALAGVGIGAAGAFILTRVLANFSHLLYGVRAADPWTFTAVPLVLTGAALLACYIPARRAAKVDPMIALRHE
jgi:predicted permease